MKNKGNIKNRISLCVEVVLTLAICFGIAYSSLQSLHQQATNYCIGVTADYETLTHDYIRCFKILRMEAEQQIKKDLSFDEMQAWLQSREGNFREAIGEDVYDGFAFTYKGGYAHSWDYGDYSQYDPDSRPWYQTAEDANGEIAVCAPYTTFLSNTDLIDPYDTLRMSIVQKYNEDISFDFDLDVKEINALIADSQKIYNGTTAFLYDKNGYILSSSDDSYYGHNVNTADTLVSESLSDTLTGQVATDTNIQLVRVDGSQKLIYSITNKDGMTLCLLIPFVEVFERNILFGVLLAMLLIVMELMFFFRNEKHFKELEKNREMLNDALKHAESASHAKGDFMSRMSHEIRTPLNAIIGYLDIAHSDREDADKVDHCLEKSQVASKHLLSIINDVLDISSIESGRMKIAHEPFDMKQLINSLTTMFYGQAKAKGVRFEVHVDPLDYEWLVGDELRLRQILLNLLSNSVKFTPENGSVSLNIKQLGYIDQKVHLRFQVEDSGIGMSAEYKNRMFKPFEQESASTARDYGGTGLGLSISNNLVHMMGGRIDVESEQNEGTTFTIMLAFDPASDRHSVLATETFSKLRALVVDDEADTCDYVKKLLDRCGVKCDTVTNGKTAIRRVKTRRESGRPYDLCIIDWNMAEMDGLETARQIRGLQGESMPIIIATAYDYTAIADEAKSAGVSKIVSKPLFQSTLFDLLVNMFGKYEPTVDGAKKKTDFSGMKILLAEDNEMNMEIAEDILGKAGLDITPVVNGKEALDAFVSSAPGTFDAILMDIQMPEMDGYTATRKIRESAHPEAKSVPIIAMTANAFTEDVTAALAAGMNDHISKPINYQRLFDVLNNTKKLNSAELTD